MKKNKWFFIISSQVLVLVIGYHASNAFALEVIEGIGKKSAIIERKKEEAKEQQAIQYPEYEHELGVDFSKARISDLHTYWDSGTLFYYYVDDCGKFGAAINRLKKFGTSANQYQIDLNPKINEWVYANISISKASSAQTNFPSLQYHLEAYLNAPVGFEFSVGHDAKIYHNFSDQKIYAYTVSTGYYFDDYFVWVRPTHYTSQSLTFYETGITRYFSDRYNYAKLSIGSGKLPDIGDLPPLDQLTIAKQTIGVNLGGQLGMTQCLYLRWGLGYAKILYPNNLNRYITDASIGLLWHF